MKMVNGSIKNVKRDIEFDYSKVTNFQLFWNIFN
jgi:hypothetical protein